MPDYLDALKENYFADCDPAFFPDDEPIADDGVKKDLETICNLVDNAEIVSASLYDDFPTLKTEAIRSHIAQAHLLATDVMEEF